MTTTTGLPDAALDLGPALMRAYGIRPSRPRGHGGLMPAIRRLLADWRDHSHRLAIARATAHLDAHMLRDNGLSALPRPEWRQ